MPEENHIFTPVQTERVSHQIEEQIKEAIFKRHYRVGDKIPPERELSEFFSTSRTSIREALRSLEKNGFIVIKKGVQGGAFVIKGDPRPAVNSIRDMLRHAQVSLEEVLKMRLIIEPTLAAEAAEKATPQDIERLNEVVRQLREEFDSVNPVIGFERNPTFHSIIAEITGNQVFIIIMQVLMEIHTFRMNQFDLDEKTKKTILEQHKGIIEAIRNKDRAAAFERMKSHVLDVHLLHKSLDESENKKRGLSLRSRLEAAAAESFDS
ncbi:MAG: FadR/GntR family transcriptional regulator [Pseudomonadota bacterium]